MSKTVRVEDKTSGVFIITILGPIDFDTYKEVQEALAPLLVSSTKVIILNMKGVEYISSVGIGVILKAKIFMEGIGGKFIMIELKPQVETVFEIIKALPSMQVFSDMKEVENYFMKIQRDEIDKQKGELN